MNDTLFRAILSMDAYNRGYNPGISNLSDAPPSATSTVRIGSAIVFNSRGDAEAQSAGFYAIAYQMADGSKVIAYRGTDQNISWPWSDIGSDLWNGYGVGAGSAESKQAELAFKFYQTVAGAGVDLTTANISLTGHSLGGGLAGLVGAVYRRPASLFDNMAFEASAIDTITLARDAYDKAILIKEDRVAAEAILANVYKGQNPWYGDISGLHTLPPHDF